MNSSPDPWNKSVSSASNCAGQLCCFTLNSWKIEINVACKDCALERTTIHMLGMSALHTDSIIIKIKRFLLLCVNKLNRFSIFQNNFLFFVLLEFAYLFVPIWNTDFLLMDWFNFKKCFYLRYSFHCWVASNQNMGQNYRSDCHLLLLCTNLCLCRILKHKVNITTWKSLLKEQFWGLWSELKMSNCAYPMLSAAIHLQVETWN